MNMAEFREGYYYAKTHEWVKTEGDLARIGITDYAQSELGDLVYAEANAAGGKVKKGDTIGAVESVKMASDIYAPVSGEIVESNDTLEDTPEAINENAFETWFIVIRMSDPAELEELMDAEAYEKFCAEN
jgi:glycine cleavage system H protein